MDEFLIPRINVMYGPYGYHTICPQCYVPTLDMIIKGVIILSSSIHSLENDLRYVERNVKPTNKHNFTSKYLIITYSYFGDRFG